VFGWATVGVPVLSSLPNAGPSNRKVFLWSFVSLDIKSVTELWRVLWSGCVPRFGPAAVPFPFLNTGPNNSHTQHQYHSTCFLVPIHDQNEILHNNTVPSRAVFRILCCLEQWFRILCRLEHWFQILCRLEQWFQILCRLEQWFLLSRVVGGLT
jgi:hypothetical protein